MVTYIYIYNDLIMYDSMYPINAHNGDFVALAMLVISPNAGRNATAGCGTNSGALASVCHREMVSLLTWHIQQQIQHIDQVLVYIM